MKKLFTFLMLFALALSSISLVACKDTGTIKDQDIIGTWTAYKLVVYDPDSETSVENTGEDCPDITYVFNEDKTAVYSEYGLPNVDGLPGYSLNGTWSLKNDVLKINIENGTIKVDISFDDEGHLLMPTKSPGGTIFTYYMEKQV